MITSEHTPTHRTISDRDKSVSSHMTSLSSSSLQSKLSTMKLDDLYRKITALMILMKEKKIDRTDSLLQSVVTMESDLKSEKCREKLSFLYIFVLGLCRRMKLIKPQLSVMSGSVGNRKDLQKQKVDFEQIDEDKENSIRINQKASGDVSSNSYTSSITDFNGKKSQFFYLLFLFLGHFVNFIFRRQKKDENF